MFKLDLKDRKILYELDANSRQPVSRIAKRVRLNKSTVNYKIKQLENEGVISGYYAMIDNTKLGYLMFRVYLKFINTTPEKETEIIYWLRNNKAVGVVGRFEAVYDLIIMVWTKSVHEFDDFLFEFKKRFRGYIWQEKVHIYSKVWHFKRKYLLKEEKPQEHEFVGSNKVEDYDELDINILKLLSKKARMSVVEISEILKIPERTIAFRIRQLEKKHIIQGYRANINLEKIEYEYYKLNIILNNFSKYDELFNYARDHPNVTYIERTASELDFEIDVEIESKQALLRFVKDIKSKFGIRNVEIVPLQEYYKIESLPQ
jgi:DNA-binding Lrp family transcriptional regulator